MAGRNSKPEVAGWGRANLRGLNGSAAINAEFFALAFFAALNPKLLAVDLLLIENRRPRAMFLSVLVGGLTVGLTIGLLDVLVVHLDAINSQKTVSAGVDLGLGLVLLAAGALVATGRLPGRRKAPVPAGAGYPESRRTRTAGQSGCWPSPAWGWPCSSARCAASPAPATSPGCTS